MRSFGVGAAMTAGSESVCADVFSCFHNTLFLFGFPELAIKWGAIGLILALLFVFGIWFAWLTRWMALHGVEGQTAYMVVFGTFVTLIGAGLLIGFEAAAVVFACFAASGGPMVFEYVSRIHAMRMHDQQRADELARDLLR